MSPTDGITNCPVHSACLDGASKSALDLVRLPYCRPRCEHQRTRHTESSQRTRILTLHCPQTLPCASKHAGVARFARPCQRQHPWTRIWLHPHSPAYTRAAGATAVPAFSGYADTGIAGSRCCRAQRAVPAPDSARFPALDVPEERRAADPGIPLWRVRCPQCQTMQVTG